MLGWIRQYRRRQIQSSLMPVAWSDVLAHHALFRSRLDEDLRSKLDRAIQVLVAEKNWEGCGGLSISDEHRVTIAAHAARLTLGFEEDYFDEVQSILIYPSAYEARSHDAVGPGVVVEGQSGRVGEAWYRGPVILAWSDVLRSARGARRGQNVVIHEFSHQLDMRNGRAADGVPVIESVDQAKEWIAVTARDYQRLCDACRHDGHAPVLDCYGTTNLAEFFAVATEAFFEAPHRLAADWPDLYGILRRFYRQEPA